MAAVTKKYPRATIRKVVKAHTNKNIGRNVDALVDIPHLQFMPYADLILQLYLDYVLFMQRYAH